MLQLCSKENIGQQSRHMGLLIISNWHSASEHQVANVINDLTTQAAAARLNNIAGAVN